MQARLVLGFALLALGSCDLIDHLPPPPYGGHGGGSGGSGGATLVINHQPLTGFTVSEADARRKDPRAGEPEYVYLQAGRDAVRLPGPAVPDVGAPSLFTLESPGVVEDKGGFTVTVNGRLGYRVAIDDFEQEISLARVELVRQGDVITSSFIFPGHAGAPYGGGVAHGLTIQAVVGGVAGAPTSPVTVEARP